MPSPRYTLIDYLMAGLVALTILVIICYILVVGRAI